VQALLALLWYDSSMLRTRDFILVFITVVFLVLAIGTSWIYQDDGAEAVKALQFNEANPTDFTAEIYVPAELSRDQRVAQMRTKIAESGTVIIAAAEPEPQAADDQIDGERPTTQLQLCPNYQQYSGIWPAQGLQIELAEGARLVYTESVTDVAVMPLSTSSSPQPHLVERTVLLQLSTNPFISPNPSCVTSDVIGLAQDGSLIRNNEAGLYSVFSDQTLIGYALDGHPIYGVSEAALDTCGGAIVAGQYGYYLSESRETVLNCFVSPPVSMAVSI